MVQNSAVFVDRLATTKFSNFSLASYPSLPMLFNVHFLRETLKNMGRPGYEATLASTYFRLLVGVVSPAKIKNLEIFF